MVEQAHRHERSRCHDRGFVDPIGQLKGKLLDPAAFLDRRGLFQPLLERNCLAELDIDLAGPLIQVTGQPDQVGDLFGPLRDAGLLLRVGLFFKDRLIRQGGWDKEDVLGRAVGVGLGA